MTDLNKPHRIFRWSGGALDLESVCYITTRSLLDGEIPVSRVHTPTIRALEFHGEEAKAVMDAWVAYHSLAPRERL